MNKILYLFLVVGLFGYGGVVAEEEQLDYKIMKVVKDRADYEGSMPYAEVKKILEYFFENKEQVLTDYMNKVNFQGYRDKVQWLSLAGRIDREWRDRSTEELFVIDLCKVAQESDDFDSDDFKKILGPHVREYIEDENTVRKFSERDISFLSQAIELNCLPLVELSVKYGADLRAIPLYAFETPLHKAVRFGHLEIVQFLLDQEGVNVNSRRKSREETPLAIAIEYQPHSPKIIELLLERGANFKIDVAGFQSAIEFAASLGNARAVQLLMEAYERDPKLTLSESLKEEIMYRSVFSLYGAANYPDMKSFNVIQMVMQKLKGTIGVINLMRDPEYELEKIYPIPLYRTKINLDTVTS